MSWISKLARVITLSMGLALPGLSWLQWRVWCCLVALGGRILFGRVREITKGWGMRARMSILQLYSVPAVGTESKTRKVYRSTFPASLKIRMRSAAYPCAGKHRVPPREIHLKVRVWVVFACHGIRTRSNRKKLPSADCGC